MFGFANDARTSRIFALPLAFIQPLPTACTCAAQRHAIFVARRRAGVLTNLLCPVLL
uniref:Uncharacterized protein n=1 Tax=Ralstonia solanacearum TaxID=305 RepID=A0A0S4V7M2_RALSL|nr:protein of unknown function [Ralstonia solanacearum]